MKEKTRCVAGAGAALALFLAACGACADQLEMLNGDHYVGKVLSLNTNTIVWQSDVLGTVKLPRNKVLSINLGSGATANPDRLPGASLPAGGGDGPGGKPHPSANPSIHPSTPPSPQTSAAPTPQSPDLRQLGANTNLVAQI